MAIATLSTLATTKYRGASALTLETGLVADLNTVIAKVNEVVNGIGDYDTLEVGDGLAGAAYYAGDASWLSIDGTNPPTLERLRILDEDDGAYKTVTCASGALVVT